MDVDAAAVDGEPEVTCSWSARKLQPVTLLWVALVFLGLMAVSHFILHSTAGVKALAIGAIGFIVPLAPQVLMRMEHRLSESELERRRVDRGDPKPFESVFRVDELSHIHRVGAGFKYFKRTGEATGVRRFYRLHLSDAHSGEVHVEKEDRDRVFAALTDLGVEAR